jgi:hypothetical protein
VTTNVYRFEKVSRSSTKTDACPTCGRTVKRSRTFTNTINPFNKDPETGLPRTRAQIWEKLGKDIEAWVPDFEHEKCREARVEAP